MIHAQILFPGQHNRGEGLVDVKDINIIQCQTSKIQNLTSRGNRALSIPMTATSSSSSRETVISLNGVLQVFIRRNTGATPGCTNLALFAPLINLVFWNAIPQSSFNRRSRTDTIDPPHDSRPGSDIHLAPLPASKPGIKRNVRDGKGISADPRFVSLLSIKDRHEAQSLIIETLYRMTFFFWCDIVHIPGVTQFIAENRANISRLPINPRQHIPLMFIQW